ncbi:alanine racemase [uncultured Parolsenella sp.]|uniref:alanine racemase n=1 Tax=uncultured Parolsenella sp. TaxID=2083008 RepID=UPI0027D93296|nr:alanine racemase [uncultured Parolsenella sp.]
MFLDRLLATNPALAELALAWHADGTVEPDTYLLDLDAIRENARAMLDVATPCGISLYYMLKQIGRNPLVAQALQEEGLAGAVCVDWREAQTLAAAPGVRLGNVGHLVQTPVHALSRVLAARPEVVTVYSLEKAAQVGAEAERQGFVQPLLLRVLDDGDTLYSGQYGGFGLSELPDVLDRLEAMSGVRVGGACSFPCFLYDDAAGDVAELHNAETVRRAIALMCERGYEGLQANMPSTSCAHVVPMAAAAGATHMEPGHGLTGTTPYHAAHPAAAERVAYAYVSELSHNLDGHGYCFGGGHYRRGHVHGALVGNGLVGARRVNVTPPTDESIDYHFELSEPGRVGEGVLMCFRTQVFVTRSEVAVVGGLSSGAPVLEGVFDAQGRRLR